MEEASKRGRSWKISHHLTLGYVTWSNKAISMALGFCFCLWLFGWWVFLCVFVVVFVFLIFFFFLCKPVIWSIVDVSKNSTIGVNGSSRVWGAWISIELFCTVHGIVKSKLLVSELDGMMLGYTTHAAFLLWFGL